MRISALAATLLSSTLVFAPSLAAQAPALQPVATRVAAQNAIFEESWQTQLKLSPTLATAVGDYRYNDQLADYSLAAIDRRHQINLTYLTRIKAISPEGFSEEDRTSHDLFVRELQESADDYDLKEYEMPIAAGNGPHTQFADLPNAVPLDSVKHYEDYVARLHQIPRCLMQSEDVLRAGVKDKLVPVKFVAEKVPGQVAGIIAADPFLTPLKRMPASFSDADKKRLTDAITNAVQQEVLPAYKKYFGVYRCGLHSGGTYGYLDRVAARWEAALPGADPPVYDDRYAAGGYSPDWAEGVRPHHRRDDRACEGEWLRYARCFPGAHRERPEIYADVEAADYRRLCALHRADETQAAAAVHGDSERSGYGGRDSGLSGGRIDPLSERDAGR